MERGPAGGRHARHADHARWGCGKYLVAEPGKHLFRARLGETADIRTVPYGQPVDHNGVRVSFHPAGHVLGSAQVRLEHRGEVWVVTGDYKLDADPTCLPFEPVPCHTLITESTFGLPIYRWDRPDKLFADVNSWWRANQAAGKCSIVYAYALGKAQRLMAGVDATIGPIYTHGAVEKVTLAYRESGISLPPTTPAGAARASAGRRSLARVPGDRPAVGVPLERGCGSSSRRRRRWPRGGCGSAGRGGGRRWTAGSSCPTTPTGPACSTAVHESGAARVLVTHGFAGVLARYLRERGLDAGVIATRYGDEEEGSDPTDEEAAP